MTDCIQVSFPWASKKIEARFDSQPLSSDGGLLLVRQADEQLKLLERAAKLLVDDRERGKVQHEVLEILRQRVYGICAGYEDCNDAGSLRDDPLHRLVVGADLASQPTLSRFENSQGWRVLLQLNDLLLELAKRDLRKAREIVLDVDSTDDETHGQQEFSSYHGFYEQHIYHPLLIYANDRLVGAWLRPGNVHAGRGSATILRGLIRRIRKISKGKIVLRADAGFALPRLYRMLEKEKVDYTIGMITNDRLRAYAAQAIEQAQQLYQEKQAAVQLFGDVAHRAGSWSRSRRVVYKAEVMPQGENRRFVVTNREGKPEAIYTFYRARGDAENRIKDLKNALQSGRTSCHKFLANFFRLLEHSLAYVLLDHLRRKVASAEMRSMQFDTLRLKLIKVGALVEESVRRFMIHLPKGYPWKKTFTLTARALAPPLRE